MNTTWRQRSLRVRLAAWYAGVGVAVLVACLMAALISGVWLPASRTAVLMVLLVFLPGAAGVFAAAGYFVAGRALAPLKVLAERARRLSARSLSERLPVINPRDELGQLTGVFNEMLGRLEDSFAELKRFTADASHELRTPLTAIRAVGEVGLHQGDTPGLRDAVGSMLEEAARLNQLIDRLLLLAQADDDMAPVHLGASPVRDVVTQVTDLLSVVAEEKGQSFDVEEVQDVFAVMDPELLHLALMNLVQNAIRYGPPGKPIRLRTAASGAQAILEVADEGPGIARQHHARIFERFYRVDRARSRPQGGTGLGLAIVKWAAARMNGSVEIVSEAGRGSTFRLRLPLAGGGANAGQPAVAAQHAGAQAVEDERFEPQPELFADPHEGAHLGLRDVFNRLRSDPHGLAWSEARRRLEHFGPNETVSRRVPNWPKLLWHAANNPFNGVLVLLGVVSLLTHDFEASFIMTVMVVMSTGLRFWQERKSLI